MGRRSGRAVVRALAVVGLLLGACTVADDEGDAGPSRSSSDDTAATTAPAGSGPRSDGGPATTPDSTPDASPASGPLPEGRDVTVTSITDGDTFRAGDERVRLIGIDTPEVSGGTECFGAEASAALERLVPVGSEVRLVADVEPVDRHGRTLAYVHRLPDGLDVNLRMATDGFALPLTVPPNVARERAFADAASQAREAGRGLWSACADDVATEVPTTVAPPSAGAGRDGCEPAYPDVCIPPSPPDLDCADVPHRRFTVLPPDPHRFDGGGDGIGCESG